jgi:hypothetical protein
MEATSSFTCVRDSTCLSTGLGVSGAISSMLDAAGASLAGEAGAAAAAPPSAADSEAAAAAAPSGSAAAAAAAPSSLREWERRRMKDS